jgi:hypothetical protein
VITVNRWLRHAARRANKSVRVNRRSGNTGGASLAESTGNPNAGSPPVDGCVEDSSVRGTWFDKKPHLQPESLNLLRKNPEFLTWQIFISSKDCLCTQNCFRCQAEIMVLPSSKRALGTLRNVDHTKSQR